MPSSNRMLKQTQLVIAPKVRETEWVGCAEPSSNTGTREMAIYYRTRLIDYPTIGALDTIQFGTIIYTSESNQIA